jgi:hypothetical protein
VKLTSRSSLRDVAACVAGILADAGIRGVLTGGACASLHTRGAYQSADLDFVLQTSATQKQLDAAMRTAGFERQGNQYVHPETEFFVEFPPGPLAIGADFRIEPVECTVRQRLLLTLSPTDSCRDRLANAEERDPHHALCATAATRFCPRGLGSGALRTVVLQQVGELLA